MGDTERHVSTPWDRRNSGRKPTPWETVSDMQQLLGTGRDIERQPETMRDSERHVANLLDQRDSERKQITMGDSERNAATSWHWERELET